MSSVVLPVPSRECDQGRPPRRGFLSELDQPLNVFAYITPNWFACVMGTGIVAVAAATLHYQVPGLHGAAIAVWVLSVLVLVLVIAATMAHWRRHPGTARGHANNPVMVPFYGAAPMALLTVGAGTVLLGRDVIGVRAAVDVDWVLWSVGTVIGVVTAVAVPYLLRTRRMVSAADAFGGWLMPVVPPMVSASTGALLVPHAAAGPVRLILLLGCYALFGLALGASLIVITLIWHRLMVHGVGEARTVPTLWIVLGPLGQSITAVNLLGGVAHGVVPTPYADALAAAGVLYGAPVWGLAMLWSLIAATVTVRTARNGLPFSLTWWSFTFPVGTMVTGTTGLAARTGSTALAVVAAVLYVGLVGAWLVVGTRTVLGSHSGELLLRPAPIASPV